PFLCDIRKGPSVPCQDYFLTAELLPTLDRDVDILRIDLDAAADSLGDLGGRQCRPTAEEGLIDKFAALGVIQDRAPHEIHRLLGRMVVLLLFGAAHDELGRWRGPDRRVLAGLAEPRGVLLAHIPGGLMLKPVVAPRQYGAPLVPNNLLVVE